MPFVRFVLVSLIIVGMHGSSAAVELPAFRPDGDISGTIRIAGSPDDHELVEAWEAGIRAFDPGIHIAAALHGPDSTMAGLYTGTADLALLERELKLPVEHMAFTWVHQHSEFSVTVANAGVRTNRLGAAIAIFVNAANPIEKLTLAQVDSLFGAEHRRGGTALRFWGDVGLTGTWANRPIHIYGPDLDSSWALSIRDIVLQDSYKWNPSYRVIEGDETAVLAALAKDEAGVSFGPLASSNSNVKPLQLADREGGVYAPLDTAAISSQSYPLSRRITMVMNREPSKALDPKIKEFLRYVLSREGQAAIAADGAYVPLTAAEVERELAKLD